MGAILEGVEYLKTPGGWLVLALIIGAGYLYYRWMFKEEQKGPESK